MFKQLFIFIALAIFCLSLKTDNIPKSTLSKKVAKKLTPILKKEFKSNGFKWGEELYFRVFKKEKKFEVWIKKGNKFSLFKTYDVCYFSGGLGTKTKQGDGKSPEGFYFVKPAQLNPYSSYHLAFNIGYPNSYERQKRLYRFCINGAWRMCFYRLLRNGKREHRRNIYSVAISFRAQSTFCENTHFSF
tara:strand:+ start:55 stop:618 length:564 start_codon:yes stop_codon:yes gene_type:complete